MRFLNKFSLIYKQNTNLILKDQKDSIFIKKKVQKTLVSKKKF